MNKLNYLNNRSWSNFQFTLTMTRIIYIYLYFVK